MAHGHMSCRTVVRALRKCIIAWHLLDLGSWLCQWCVTRRPSCSSPGLVLEGFAYMLVRMIRWIPCVLSHLLTSGWVPLGPVRSRRGSSGTRMGPYLSRTPIRVHPVFRQGSSGPVGSRRDISAKSAKVRSGPKTSNLLRNGSRIDRLARNKDQMNRIACPDPSGPLLRPKMAKKIIFKGKRPPAAPADLGGPPHSYRRRPGPTYHFHPFLSICCKLRLECNVEF